MFISHQEASPCHGGAPADGGGVRPLSGIHLDSLLPPVGQTRHPAGSARSARTNLRKPGETVRLSLPALPAGTGVLSGRAAESRTLLHKSRKTTV